MSTTSPRKILLINNSIFSLLSWILPVVIGFVATPLIVRNLGNREYGLYATILGFISYSFSFGIGRILTKYVAEYRASGESDKIGEVVSATFWLSLALAFGGSLIVAGAARYIVFEVLFLPADQQQVGEVGLYLACAAIIVTMLSQTFQFILQGLHRFGTFVLLTNISGVLLNIGNVALALLGYGIVELLTWNFIALSLMAMAFAYDAVRHLPEFSLRPRFRSPAWSIVLKYGSSIILYQVFSNVLLAFERGWVVRKFGPASATFYIVPMTLAIYMHGMVASATLALFPAFNELLTDTDKFTELYRKATKVMVATTFMLATMLICGGHQLLQVWINQDMADKGYPVFVIQVLTFALIAIMIMIWQLSESFRAPLYNTLATFIWMIVAIPLMILTADRWNIEGVAASRLIAVAVTLPLIFILENRFLGHALWRYWLTIGWRTSSAAVVMAILLYLYFWLVPLNFVLVGAGFACGAAVYLSMLLITGFFTKDERQMFGELIGRMRK